MIELQGRVAVVTGGATGIGRGCCECLARAGATVVVADVLGDAAAELAVTLGGMSFAVGHDVRDAASAQTMVTEVLNRLGRIDILVNNAGVGSRPARIEDTSEDEYDRVMDVNVRGVFLTTREVVPVLRGQKSGRIINISSVVGQTGRAMIVPYTAAKHAVIGITQSLAEELASDDITVNAVCPGIVETGLHANVVAGLAPLQDRTEQEGWEWFRSQIPLQRFQTPHDIGNMVAYLASDLAANITGACFNVDGGSEMH